MKKIKNLLVVDDDLISSYLISSTLKDMAIAEKISTVFNGKQAIEFLEQNFAHDNGKEFCPAFILLDLNMPIMDGFEFLAAFQHKFATFAEKIPICILSSSFAQKDKDKAFQYPIAGFIVKPLTKENLLHVLEKM